MYQIDINTDGIDVLNEDGEFLSDHTTLDDAMSRVREYAEANDDTINRVWIDLS